MEVLRSTPDIVSDKTLSSSFIDECQDKTNITDTLREGSSSQKRASGSTISSASSESIDRSTQNVDFWVFGHWKSPSGTGVLESSVRPCRQTAAARERAGSMSEVVHGTRSETRRIILHTAFVSNGGHRFKVKTIYRERQEDKACRL
ncbi:unnamed protein product, partial [Pleuronectes platessa]